VESAFKDYTRAWAAMDGDLGDYVRSRISSKAGLVPMQRRWDLGFRRITANTPVMKADDLAGKKLRVPGAPALVSLFTALGASRVSMQLGEVYTSLQSKVIDGHENPLSVIDAGKFYEVQKNCAMSNHFWDGYWVCANSN
jgi:TRAP-type C4-dicarboxylate transport system substrate-binding protein